MTPIRSKTGMKVATFVATKAGKHYTFTIDDEGESGCMRIYATPCLDGRDDPDGNYDVFFVREQDRALLSRLSEVTK